MDVKTFNIAMAFTLPHEGGYCNIPQDKGGATNRGITQATYDAYLKGQGRQSSDVRYINDVEVDEIYYYSYYLPARCQNMDTDLAVVHFDTAVNTGIGQASKFLQRALGVKDDGIVGIKTLTELAKSDGKTIIESYLNQRENFYRAIVDKHPDQRLFLQGWLNRVNDLREYIKTV